MTGPDSPQAPLTSQSHALRTGQPSFSLTNRCTRAVWIIIWWTLARWTPRQWRPWRAFLLRCFGANLAHGADVRESARVWLPAHLSMGVHSSLGPHVNCYNQGPVSIGDFVVVSQGAYLCTGTHDYESEQFQLITRPIVIGAHCWLAAHTFVGPGTTLEDGVVLGACAVANGHYAEWHVYGGNPARPIKSRRRLNNITLTAHA